MTIEEKILKAAEATGHTSIDPDKKNLLRAAGRLQVAGLVKIAKFRWVWRIELTPAGVGAIQKLKETQ